jgi:hypothetical protein
MLRMILQRYSTFLLLVDFGGNGMIGLFEVWVGWSIVAVGLGWDLEVNGKQVGYSSARCEYVNK